MRSKPYASAAQQMLAREAKRRGTAALAKMLGVTRKTLWGYCTGNMVPTILAAGAIRAKLKIELEWWLNEPEVECKTCFNERKITCPDCCG